MHSGRVSTVQEPVYVPAGHQTLSALSKTSAVALCGNGLAYVCEFLVAVITVGLSRVALLPVLIFALIAWITAGLILMRIRRASAVAAVVGLLSFIYLVVPSTRSGLLHPTASPLHFGLLVVTFAFALVAIISGIAATVQMKHYHGSAQSAPRWLRSLLGGMSGLVVGMIVIAALVGANPQSSSAHMMTNGIPTVHMVGGNFQTNVVLVPKGGRLMLTDDDGVEHIIQNGSWTTSSAPQPQVEPGAPALHNRVIKGGSITIGPFNTAGVFHLYCPIHLGMNLTVVVQ